MGFQAEGSRELFAYSDANSVASLCAIALRQAALGDSLSGSGSAPHAKSASPARIGTAQRTC